MAEISHGSVSANGVDFSYLTAGDPDAPLALCLHGFPDSAHGWRHLLPELAAAGYRAVAPFQRGYAPTSVPADGRFQTGALSMDAIALHEVLGADQRAVIIGHDWGASGTHGAAVFAPERWAKVVTMAVPPGPAVGMAFVTNLAQVQRSWYMFFFQHALADFVVAANDLAFIDLLWSQWSPGYDATVDLVNTKASLRHPANLTAALGYYRATLGEGYKDPALDEIQAAGQGWATQPHLYLHGRNDGCVGAEVAEAAAAMAPSNVIVEFIENAGHFLHLEQTALVNARIIEFLS
ncbi:MAG TPA: alpha/beta hydrolase [Ilumatobacteraceae bacterium]|nr:alpha/beta hydrolase [Ilumatobacteraceae bacterium]HRB03577.1 alpha/beta hydrolase [Ilumatobacteraceae bacterium]